MKLPEFDRPPVTEVAIGLQFTAIAGLRQPHFGLFWPQIRADFPQVQDQPPLPHQKLVAARPQSFQIEFSTVAYPTPRSWFVSESNDHLVQIQADRLVFNWRGGGEQYPRYDTLRPRFDALFGAWSAFLEREGLGRPVPEQIEVAYVNTIESSGIGKILLGFDVPTLEPGGVAMQDHFVASHRIPDGEGTAMLQVEAANLQGPSADQVVLSLTYRADVADESSVGPAFDDARASIVRTFAKITRPELRASWGES